MTDERKDDMSKTVFRSDVSKTVFRSLFCMSREITT